MEYFHRVIFFFFFFNDTATTEIYTLSLHDALPIWAGKATEGGDHRAGNRLAQRLVSLLTLAQLVVRSEEHTSELQSQSNLVCRLLLEKKKKFPSLRSSSFLTNFPSGACQNMSSPPT